MRLDMPLFLELSDARSDALFDLGVDCSSGATLRQSIFASFHAQHAEKAGRFLAEMMGELDEDARSSVVGHEREIIATAIVQALKGLAEGGGQGLSFEQMLRRTLNEILRTSYNVKIAVYRAYKSSANSFRKGPSHDDQLLRNRELVGAVDLAKKNAELKKVVLQNTKTLLHSRFPAEAFCADDREDLKVNARQISDLVDNFYLWFLEQMGETEMLVGYSYVFGGLDAKAVEEKVKVFEARDFAPIEDETPPEGQELMASYDLAAAAIDACYEGIKGAFESDGERYLARFLEEVSLQDTDSMELISNWKEIRRHRDKVFAPVVPDRHEKRGRRPLGMELSALNLDKVEKMQIAIPESEWEICLDEINIMRLQRGNLSARNKVLLRISRLIGSVCRKGYAAYWLQKSGLSDAVLDLQQELSVEMMGKMAMYDPTKSRLSTYMCRWIESAVRRVIGKETLMPLPAWTQQVLSYCRRHPEASDQEVLDHFHSINIKIALKTISRLRSTDFQILDLDDPIESHDPKGDGKSKGTIGDLIVASRLDEQKLPAAMRAYRLSIVHRLLATLPPRHAYILTQRYIYEKELQVIADELRISREAVELIELYALENLRFHTDVEDLKADRKVQKGTRSRVADTPDPDPSRHVFLVFDQDAWQQWCIAQRDVSAEQMLWFRLYLGLEESKAFARLQPTAIRKYRGEIGKQFELSGFYRVIRLLRDRLQRSLAALPEGERFVRSFSRYEMFKNAGELLNNLKLTE